MNDWRRGSFCSTVCVLKYIFLDLQEPPYNFVIVIKGERQLAKVANLLGVKLGLDQTDYPFFWMK